MKKLLTIILGVGIMVTVFAFSHIMSTNRMEHKELPQAKLKDEYLKKEMFTIMLNDGTGNYEASENPEFPKDGYVLNETKSGCINREGKEVKDVISYNSENKTIGIRTKEEVYCYLYYDIAEIAGEFTFYIKDDIEDNYTKEKTNTGYLSWEADGITSYCISESDDVKNCSEWTNVDGVKSANKEYTFTNDTNEEKTVYAYIKNKAGVTKQASDTIGYDTEAPTIDTFTIKGTNGHTSYTSSNSVTGDLTYNDNLSGVDEICIYNSNSSASCNWVKVKNASSINNVDGELLDSYSYEAKYMYAFAKDKAGNITSSGKQSSNSLLIEPSFFTNIFLKSYTANSITVTAVANASSGIASYKYTVTPSVSNNCTTSTCTLSGLSAGTEYTITVTVTSNVGITGYDTLKIMPAKSYSTSLASLCSGKTLNACMASEYSNLNSKISDIYLNQGGMARYQGIHGEVSNNYICLGSNCTNGSDDMYRIIGITSDGQLKVIKQTYFNGPLAWLSNASVDTQWPDSDLFHRLNDNGSGTYATTSFYYGLSSTLKNHIDDEHSWNYGDVSSSEINSFNGSTMYNYESNLAASIISPIGLMYIHDYYLAYKGGNPSSYNNVKNAWINYKGNDERYSILYDWTIMRMKAGTRYYYGIFIANSGGVGTLQSFTAFARPVFYLKSDIKLTGDGTLTSPYKIVE